MRNTASDLSQHDAAEAGNVQYAVLKTYVTDTPEKQHKLSPKKFSEITQILYRKPDLR